MISMVVNNAPSLLPLFLLCYILLVYWANQYKQSTNEGFSFTFLVGNCLQMAKGVRGLFGPYGDVDSPSPLLETIL